MACPALSSAKIYVSIQTRCFAARMSATIASISGDELSYSVNDWSATVTCWQMTPCRSDSRLREAVWSIDNV
jgi:hypothetical protein